MSLNAKKSKLKSLAESFDEPVTFTVETKKGDDKIIPGIGQETKKNEQKTNEWTPTPASPSKAQHFWAKREPLTQKCKFFVLQCKPKGKPKGYRSYLFYYPPLYLQFNYQDAEQELITFNNKSHFYIEGRYLVIIDENNKETTFSIKKPEVKTFLELCVQNQDDVIASFFDFIIEMKDFPEISFLSLYFYEKAFEGNRFYYLLSFLPKELTTDEFFSNYIYAIDPFVDSFFEFLFDTFFISNKNQAIEKEPKDVFVFTLIHHVLRIDDNVTKGCKVQLDKTNSLFDTLINLLKMGQFNFRTKMILHILYSKTRQYIFDENTAFVLLSSVLVNEFLNHFMAKHNKEKYDLLKSIDKGSQGKMTLEQYNSYKECIKDFSNQPADFKPAVPGPKSIDGFKFIAKTAFMNPKVFQNIIKQHPIHDVLT